MPTLIQKTASHGEVRFTFSRSDKSVNIMDEAFLTQFEKHLDALEQETVDSVVFLSSLPNCFIAGADLSMIADVQNEQDAVAMAKRGQLLCRRIEALSATTIAVVQGSCMGGGLELALACHAIIAVEHGKTQFALPEIKIGIHPGFGGCVRLPKRVGWLKAIDMIMTGRILPLKAAKRAGLVDLTCYPEKIDAAIALMRQKGVTKRKQKPWWLRIYPVRRLFFHLAMKKAQQKFSHLDLEQTYPAIPATLRLLEKIYGVSDDIAYNHEAKSLASLATTKTCKSLIRVFFLGESLKNQDAVKKGRKLLAKEDKSPKVAVFGAGIMGSGIAWVCTKLGQVDLHDLNSQVLGRGLKAAAKFAKREPRRLQWIRPVQNKSGLHNTDVVIEAILEDIDIKKALWRDVEAAVPEDTLLLSNTSSLSITAQQQDLNHPKRMAGLHFFNPAPKMPLVEVIAGAKTSKATLHKAAALAANMGKYPIIAADTPGFLVNRCLMPYMSAAITLFEQGQTVEHIDSALKSFGMPMGALHLADQVGLDICCHVGAHLGEAFGERMQLPSWLQDVVKGGHLGVKSGQGFYIHQAKKRSPHQVMHKYASTKHAIAMQDQSIVDACLLPMLVEACLYLQENEDTSLEQFDAAMIYGMGFPPFRGGLLFYYTQRPQEELAQAIAAHDLNVPENLSRLYTI
ncbi:MAG: 3-hydroxyacyl-CoA dehydrogenase NAD-binding domain-containing protein [Mariprofundaceae bacterium]|nr:3-hydroxyacyl-CoA dehydrogenase NAD-binding domain-containing protein [Mariprofundaceae bacterium]